MSMSDFKITELGLIPINWQIKTVGEMVKETIIEKPLDGNHGEIHPKGSDFMQSGIPFIMATDIKNGQIDLTNCKFISEEQARSLNKGFSIVDDVLITHKATLGRTAIVGRNDFPFIMLTPQVTYYRVKDKTKLSNSYLRYYFNSSIFQDVLKNHADSGSTRAYVGITAQLELPIILPPLEEQKAIAEVLTSLDDKIDLLHKQNKTLEQLAETLFRHHFIDNSKDDWEEGNVTDEFSLTMGQSPPGNSFNEEGLGIPMFQGNADFEFRFPKKRIYTTEPKKFAEKYDTLISVRAPVGEQNMASERCCIGRGVAAFRYKNEQNFYSYTYFKMKSLMEEIKQFNQTGTVFGSISKTDFENLKITIPSFDEVSNFQEKIFPIDSKIITNCDQIKSLEKLRDKLLPKLMSGEIKLNQQTNNQ